jgi:hypothetical protein
LESYDVGLPPPFDGDVATMLRWISGPHVNAQLNVTAILLTLKAIVDPDIYNDVERILTVGSPVLCNASASEANFQAYLKYGNHSSVAQNESVFASTIIKQSKRGLTLTMDPQLIHFALNDASSAETTTDLRQQFSTVPKLVCHQRLDIQENEPTLHFSESFNRFLKWQWNLANTYPDHDRYTGDDDVQCAFPRIKYNPNLVAMHSAISNGTLMMST